MKKLLSSVAQFIILLLIILCLLSPIVDNSPHWTAHELSESNKVSFKGCVQTSPALYYYENYLREVSKDQQKIYCSSFTSYSESVVKQYQKQTEDSSEIVIVLTLTGANDLCGENGIACIEWDKPYIYVKPSYFEAAEAYTTNHKFLKQVLAHEYIHTLTSKEERKWLNTNKHLFKNANNTPPEEIIADCGIGYFTEAEETTSYLPEGCYKEEWKRVAIKIIENTLIEKQGYLLL